LRASEATAAMRAAAREPWWHPHGQSGQTAKAVAPSASSVTAAIVNRVIISFSWSGDGANGPWNPA
jgi:hypothetical protein